MLLRLTLPQMLDRWRLHSAYSPSLTDTTFRRNDGIDTDAIFTSEINAWYRRLLREAPSELLNSEDFASEAGLPEPVDGANVIPMPAEVVRVLEVRLSTWRTSARIVTSPTHILAERQRHPFTRATPSHPVAIFTDGYLHLYPAADSTDSILTLRCITHRNGEYIFDDSLLSEIQ